MDLIILVVTLVCLTAIIKPFTFPGDSNFEDASSTLALFLGILAYFYGVDFFPATSFLAPLHLITIGLVNAFSIIDLFILTLLGTPLTLNLIFVVIVPSMVVYKIAKELFSYTEILSETTENFIASIVAFLSMVAAVRGDFNLIQIVWGALIYLVSYVTGQSSVYLMTVSIMIISVIVLAIALAFETMTVKFVLLLVEGSAETE